MIHSIRSRIAIFYVILVIVSLLGTGIYLSYALQQIYLNDFQSTLFTEAKLIGDALPSQSTIEDSPDSIQSLVKKWASRTNTQVAIINPDGMVIVDSGQDPELRDDNLSLPEIAQSLATGEGINIRISSTAGVKTIYVASAVYQDGKLTAIVRVAIPFSQAQNKVGQIQRAILLGTLSASVIAIILTVWIAVSISAPLQSLAGAVLNHTQNGLEKPNRKIPPQQDIERIVHAFNLMQGQIQIQNRRLEIERSKVSAIFEAMTDGVIIVDADGLIQSINPAAERIFSIEKENVLGHTLAEGLRHHQLVELWQQSQTTGKFQSALIEISTERLYIQGIANPLGEVHPAGTILLFNNLTRQRFLETVRRDFVSNISHELRTPLASLKALNETLQFSALDDPPAARRFLQRMETEIDALSQMVAELFELSRIESGQVPLQFQDVNPCDIIISAVDRLRLQAERAGLSLNIHCPDDTPQIQADSPRLEQVVVNLLHNAIKFTNPGGEINVTAELEEDASTDQELIRFAVSDTGVGISPDELPRIFERFYKTDRSRSEGGTGLGLAIARHVVEAHNGRIWAESTEGQGSTFYFSIPVSQSSQAE